MQPLALIAQAESHRIVIDFTRMQNKILKIANAKETAKTNKKNKQTRYIHTDMNINITASSHPPRAFMWTMLIKEKIHNLTHIETHYNLADLELERMLRALL